MTFASGLLIGVAVALGWPARVVEAQGAWQCRSWTLEEKGDAGAVGTWLGTARAEDIHMTAAVCLLAHGTRWLPANGRMATVAGVGGVFCTSKGDNAAGPGGFLIV